MGKKLTVILWDADYRESLEDSLMCLESQTALDDLEIFFIEWTSKKKPVVLKYDFINVVNINSTERFDTGAQWNLGLYLANTEWVSYSHCDIMPADHYEKIINKINNLKNSDIIYLEGWHVNTKNNSAQYRKYKKRVANKLWLLPDLFLDEKKNPPEYKRKRQMVGGGAAIVKKMDFISEVHGWSWNLPTKYWCGPAYQQPNLPRKKNGKLQGVRKYLVSRGKALIKNECPEIYQFSIPHRSPVSSGLGKSAPSKYNVKYYSHLASEWLATQKITIRKAISVYPDDVDKKYLKSLIKKENPVILDIGCYDGSDALEFLNIFDNPKIYAFEADERSIKIFHKNVTKEQQKNILLQKCAVCNTNGEVDWYASHSESRRHFRDYDFQDSWSASSSIKKPKDCLKIFDDISYKKLKKVRAVRLDSWIENFSGIERVDIMWVDVNGASREFISGALETLKKTKYLYIEFCKTNTGELFEGAISRKEILELLPFFEEISVHSFLGNYGNTLLRNKNYD